MDIPRWDDNQILIAGKREMEQYKDLSGYIVVVIDVIAHTSLMPQILAAEPSFVVGSRVSDAWNAYQELGTDTWVIGDVVQRKEFSGISTLASNSPYLFMKDNIGDLIKGKNVVVATNNGTACSCLALDRHPDLVISASLRNLDAVVGFLHQRHSTLPQEKLLFFASGETQLGERPVEKDEDYLFSEYVRYILLGCVKYSSEDLRFRIKEIWETEYAELEKRIGATKEKMEGDISFILHHDACPVIPQADRIEGKSYINISKIQNFSV